MITAEMLLSAGKEALKDMSGAIDGEDINQLVLVDILNALVLIRKQGCNEDMESYIINALSGGILDRKSARQLESMLKQ